MIRIQPEVTNALRVAYLRNEMWLKQTIRAVPTRFDRSVAIGDGTAHLSSTLGRVRYCTIALFTDDCPVHS